MTTKKAAEERGINFAAGAREFVSIPFVTAVSQADVKAFSFRPGYAFKIKSVQTYCLTKTGTVTTQVKIGTVAVSAAASAFTAATRVDTSLNAAAGKGGGKLGDINVHYTTDGTGALVNGFVVIGIEPAT